MDNGHLWIHFHYTICYFLINCDENIFVKTPLRYDMRILKKVLKECYNIIPDKEGRYS